MGQFHIVFLFFGTSFYISQDEYWTIVDEIIKIKNAALNLFPMRPISQLGVQSDKDYYRGPWIRQRKKWPS